jgi:hypothetical protein
MLRPGSVVARFALSAAALLGLSTIAVADVTVALADRTQGTPGPGVPPDSLTFLKGGRERVDRGPTSTILDLDAGRLVVLDHVAKTATIYRLDDLRPRQHDLAQVNVDVELTAKTRQFGRFECRQANVSLVTTNPRQPMPGGVFEGTQNITTGIVWIATDIPGAEEFRAFNQRLEKSGAVVTDFLLARRESATAVAQARFATMVAAKGIPCGAQLSSRGLQPLAGSELIFPSHSNEWQLQSVSTEPLADTLFEVPSGYAVRDLTG